MYWSKHENSTSPKKFSSNILAWYDHVMRSDERHIPRRMLIMKVDECRRRRRPKKI